MNYKIILIKFYLKTLFFQFVINFSISYTLINNEKQIQSSLYTHALPPLFSISSNILKLRPEKS